MSRLDYVTIGIVVVCIAALVFLLTKTTSLFGGDKTETTPTASLTDTTAIDPYAYDSYDSTSILPNTDEDLDDNQVTPLEEEPPSNQKTLPSTSSKNQPKTKEEPRAVTTAASDRAGDYLVLAGSFSIRENADTEVERLHKLGFSNAEVSPFNKGKYAVVLVDRFTDLNDAQALVKELKGKGVDSYVQEKRDE